MTSSVEGLPLFKLYRRNRKLFDLGFIFFLVLCFFFGSWRTWGDAYVDFPQQLYVPWQLSLGKILYQDLNHYYGPLSQYWNGLIFYFFGPSYLVLAVVNLLILLVNCTAIYLVIDRLFSPPLALLVGLTLVGLHSTQQIGPIGTYNFIAPYSHEATHGITAWALGLLFLCLYFKKRQASFLFLFGLTFGAALLLKPEFALAFTLMWIVQLTFCKQNRRKDFFAVVMGTSFLPICFFLYFLARVPVLKALRNTFGAFYPIFTSAILKNPLYMQISGLDMQRENLGRLIWFLSLNTALLLIFALVDWVFTSKFKTARSSKTKNVYVRMTSFLAAFASVMAFASFGDLHTGYAYLFLLIFFVYSLSHQKLKWLDDSQIFFLALLFCSALAFLPKILLKPNIFWFGFYLLVPMSLGFVIVTWTILSKTAEQLWQGNWVFKSLFLGVSLASLVQLNLVSIATSGAKVFPVGRSGDKMYTFPKQTASVSPETLQNVIDRVSTFSKGSKILVIPEGLYINFSTLRENPTRFLQDFVNKQLFDSLGGPQKVIKEISQGAPDYIIYLRRVNEIQLPGYDVAGPQGYAREVTDWIETHYNVIEIIGTKTRDFDKLGYQLWKKNEK